jgi:nitrate/nitrite transporter NarK
VVCFYAVNFWLPTIVQEFGIDKKDLLKVGLISMVPWGFAAIAMVVNGHHSDNTGERRWHSAGGLIAAIVGMIMLATLKGAAPGIIGLTLITAGLLSWVAVFWSLPTAFLSGTAAAAGIAWINSVGNLGGYVGPLAIGWVRDHYKSGELAFYSLAACALIGAIIILTLRGTQQKAATGELREAVRT